MSATRPTPPFTQIHCKPFESCEAGVQWHIISTYVGHPPDGLPTPLGGHRWLGGGTKDRLTWPVCRRHPTWADVLLTRWLIFQLKCGIMALTMERDSSRLMPEAKERLSWLGRLKERLGRSAMSTVVETELLKDEKDEVEYVALFGDERHYTVPKGIALRLTPAGRSGSEMGAAIKAHQELYYHILHHLREKEIELSNLPETPEDSSAMKHRNELIKEAKDLEDLCIRIREHRSLLIKYEDYLGLTSTPHSLRAPAVWG